MRRNVMIRRMRRVAMVATMLAGGTVLANGGWMNALLSVSPCGTILAGCSTGDWLNFIYPYLDIPDYAADPSCTIPLGCGGNASSGGGSDLFPGIPGFGGGASEQPQDTGGGGIGGGGGAGGGGGI